MPNLILSTVGTSLFTNRAPDETRSLIIQHSNQETFETMPADNRRKIEAWIQIVKASLLGTAGEPPSSFVSACKLSAEINGIASWYAGEIKKAGRDTHYLLHTDTALGKESATLVRDFLCAHNIDAQLHVMRGMNTKNASSFKQSLAGLARWLVDTLPPYSAQHWHIIFQLTGGFKSVQGFMQAAGMFLADEIVYLFEGSSELMRIPRLPIDIHSGMEATVTNHLEIFRCLASNDIIKADEFQGIQDIPEICIEQTDGMAALSPWGILCWEKIKSHVYCRQLWPSPYRNINFTKTFSSQAADLNAEQIQMLNERIDDFARYVGSGMQQTIKRLDFKQLKGNPKPPSTHEFDLWSDGKAYRAFCRKEGSAWVLDALGPGLH